MCPMRWYLRGATVTIEELLVRRSVASGTHSNGVEYRIFYRY